MKKTYATNTIAALRSLLLLLVFLLVAPATLSADPTLPTVSTDDEEVWYYVYLSRNGTTLTDNGSGNNATFTALTWAYLTAPASKQLWKLTGDNTNGYTLTSKLGNTLYLTTTETSGYGVCYTSTSPSGITTFKLTQGTGTNTDYWYISGGTSSNYLNAYQTGSDICNWGSSSDDNSAFTFVKVPLHPTASTNNNVVWYNIKFDKGTNHVAASNGDGNITHTATYQAGDYSQQWKFVGDDTNGYALYNRLGLQLNVNKVASSTVSGTDSTGFFYASSKPTYDYKTFKINRDTLTGTSGLEEKLQLVFGNSEGNTTSIAMNQYGGYRQVGHPLGFWSARDKNNYLQIVQASDPQADAATTYYHNAGYCSKNYEGASIDLTPYYYQILSDLNKTSTELATSGLYLRWHLEDANGGEVISTSDTLKAADTASKLLLTAADSSLYWFSAISDTANIATAAAKVFKVTYTTARTTDFPRIVCDITADTTNIVVSSDRTSVIQPPTTVQTKYVFTLIPDSATAAANFETNDAAIVAVAASDTLTKTDTICSLYKSVAVNLYDSITSINEAQNNSATNNFYMRWYLADASGNLLEGLQSYITKPVSDATKATDRYNQSGSYFVTDYGICYYPRKNAASMNKALEATPTVTLPPNYTWDQISLVAIYTNSSELTAWHETAVAGDVSADYSNFIICADPDTVTAKIVYKFVPTNPDTIYYHNAAYNDTASIDLTPYYYQILNDLGKTSTKLEEDGLFLRWHLTDAGGYDYEATGDTLTATATSSILKTYYTDYSLYWFSPISTTANLGTAKGDVLKVTYEAASESNLPRIVCDISADTTGITRSSSAVTQLPNTVQIRYVFTLIPDSATAAANFETNDTAIAAVAVSNTLTRVATILSIETSTTIPLYNDIDSIYVSSGTGRNYNTAAKDFYMRWYLADAKTGELIKGQYLTIKATADKYEAGCYFYTDYGICYYPRLNASSMKATDHGHDLVKPTVTLPSGYTWEQISLVAIYSEELTAWHETAVAGDISGVTDPTYANFAICADPDTITAKIVYSFVTVDPVPSKFIHSSGYAYGYADSGLGTNGQQQVHSWTYTYYVEPNSTTALIVPLDNVSGKGTDIEPNAYWRWYDYGTDLASPHLSTDESHGYSLNSKETGGASWPVLLVDADDNNCGLFKWGLKFGDYNTNEDRGLCFPNAYNVASVLFTTPDDDTWTGDTIACDVSRYFDYKDNTGDDYYAAGTFTEPTLSLRYYFNIYPAKTCAENIMNALIKDKTSPLEDQGHITMGILKNSKGTIDLHSDLSSPSSYYFYPYKSTTHQATDTEDSFDTSNLCRGTKLIWTVHVTINGTTYYHKITEADSTDNKINFTRGNLIGKYYDVTNSSNTYEITVDNIATHTFSIYFYLKDDADHFTLLGCSKSLVLTDSDPIIFSSLPRHRKPDEYLDKQYTLAGHITFDDFAGMDLSKPTAPFLKDDAANSNSWQTPMEYDGKRRWDLANYGFVYPELYHYKEADGSYSNYYDTSTEFNEGAKNSWNANHGSSPYHGDYTLIKSTDLAGVSVSQNSYTDGYRYRYYYSSNGTKTVFDQTHAADTTEYGYFLYVDASDESRPIASELFNAQLCSGSALVISVAICDLSQSGATEPQIEFQLYGIHTDTEGNIIEKQHIQSFASADIESLVTGSGSTYSNGVWYQVYGRTYISAETNAENYTQYMIVINNHCENTSGADYAIDDIRIYTRNNHVEVLQQNDNEVDCDDRPNKVHLKLRSEHATVKSHLKMDEDGHPSSKPFYYRICRYDNNAPLDENGNVASDGVGKIYTVWYTDTVSYDNPNTPRLELDSAAIEYLIFADTVFSLPAGEDYYISVALPTDTTVNGVTTYTCSNDWGNPSEVCSFYSALFVNEQQGLVITDENGSVNTTFTAECGDEVATIDMKTKLQIPDAVWGGTISIPWTFDWFVAYGTISTADSLALITAITALRSLSGYETKKIKSLSDLPTNYTDSYTEEMNTLLAGYIDKKQLFLYNDSVLNATFKFSDPTTDQALSLLLIPLAGTYIDPETNYKYTICACPMETSALLTHNGPHLMLGMTTVDYPDEWNSSAKYVRLGLDQLKALMGGTKLRLPIYGYRDANKKASGDNRNNLTMEGEGSVGWLKLTASNDPLMQAKIDSLSSKEYIYLGASDKTITPQTDSLTIDFSGANKVGTTGTLSLSNFHEGYEYTFELTYKDASQVESKATSICAGYTDLIFQIVPKYVTWTNTAENNTNWNHDDNWRRSRSGELYKSAANYADYSQNSYASTEPATTIIDTPDEEDVTGTKPTAFVPMKFTYVTIPAGVIPPNLNEYVMDNRQGIIKTLYNSTLSPATDNINYYLMVKTETTTENDVTFYDVERFYANTCKEIYFKPAAQLDNQHYLDYEKAWVDFETKPNEWTIWTSPLQHIYAGDMYVKTSGQQDTEAFEDINFTGSDYSRTAYPVYQRSWDKANSMVITASNDSRKDYDAYIDYGTTTDTLAVLSQWSHNYNDATVPYTEGYGFAIRSGKPSETYTANTRFRLPKADTSYDYYTYNGTPDGSHNASSLERDSVGILAVSNRYLSQSSRHGQLVVTIAESEQAKGYYLVGNPYMATLDMAKFFNETYNPGFYEKYWILKDGQMIGYGAGETGNSELGTVDPMTAFFLKPKTSGVSATTTAYFTPEMTIATTSSTSSSSSATARLRLTVTAGDNTAYATVVASRRADNDFRDEEDVETLFDSNLEDKPVVYTVAGQMTTQINRMSDLTNVPLGFRYNGKETLRFAVTGINRLSKPVYLRDAVAGTTTELAEGVAVTVKPNAVGRYFLTSEAAPQQAIQTSLRCYSLEAGKVVAATSADDKLTEIAVYDTAARLQKVWNPAVTSCTFSLNKGIYLITLNSEAVPEGRTFKVFVK